MAKFVKGHAKIGGRKPGGTNVQKTLQDKILGALNAEGGEEYLRRIARKHPSVFCALVGKVLPLVLAGDKNQPLQYAVTLDFGNGSIVGQVTHTETISIGVDGEHIVNGNGVVTHNGNGTDNT